MLSIYALSDKRVRSKLNPQTGFLPVSDADGRVHGEERKELLVENFVDASFPREQKFGEPTETRVRHARGVRDRHGDAPKPS